jgi:7-cyano-7-deazaguanine synthase
MRGAIVLFSGGQDSTTCLYWAKQNFDVVRAVSVVYGQRHISEIEAARKIAELASVPHDVLHCEALKQIADSALVGTDALTLAGGRPDVGTANGLPSSFVPGRNIVLMTLAASVAVKHGYRNIVSGVCQTDYSGYPDCRRPFVDALEITLNHGLPSSCGPFAIHTPLMYRTKAQTVLMAQDLPGCMEALAQSVTCYNGSRPGCGKCPACDLRQKGFLEAGVKDPAEL